MGNMNQTNNNNHLSSLEYAGMESLLQRVIDTYEDYLGISEHDRTPAGEISRRTENGIEIFDGEYDVYQIEDFAMKGFFPVDDTLVMAGRGFEDEKGQLFFEIIRIVKYHKPKVLFMENVAHLIKHDSGRTFQVITDTLDGLGYDVHYKVLKASDYGVAQIRRRIYIVCFHKDLKINFSFP